MTRTHGLTGIPEHVIWKAMKQRCENTHNPAYPNYGGRGIVVCEHWQNFSNFLADIGRRPSADLTIERLDNDGPYAPWNCRWATRLEQCRNTRTNVYLTAGEETRTITEWARALGMNSDGIRERLRYGWTVEDAVRRPKGWGDGRLKSILGRARRVTVGNTTLLVSEWATILEVTPGSLRHLLRTGRTIDAVVLARFPSGCDITRGKKLVVS